MRRFVLVFVLFLVACSNDPVPILPTMTVVPKAVVVALPTLLDSPQSWIGRPLVLITPVAITDGRVVLVPGFRSNGTQLQALASGPAPVWLVGSVPDSVKAKLAGGLGYLKLRGQLGPPGAYGPSARYPYQFTLAGSGIVQPDTTTLINLTTNTQALNDVLLKVTGTLLTTKDGTILTEQASRGGIPQNNAHQIKLRGQPDPLLLQRLASSGDVHYGLVTVIGWWHDGSLLPFVIQAAA